VKVNHVLKQDLTLIDFYIEILRTFVHDFKKQ